MFTAISSSFARSVKNWFAPKETPMKATIQPVDGKFGLFAGNELVGTYARKRDAVRGANRREFHLI